MLSVSYICCYQARAQMGMWCMLASPLIMSADLRTIRPEFKQILLNRNLIKLNQVKLTTNINQILLQNIKDIIDDVIYITDFIYRNEISVKKNEKEKNERQVKAFFKESNEKILKTFYIKMTCALDGLNNLKLTYIGDNTIKTSIDLLIGRIQTRINRLENILIVAV